MELYANLDCGLVIAYDVLPETGGMGTWPYRAAGILLILMCLPGSVYLARRRKKYAE